MKKIYMHLTASIITFFIGVFLLLFSYYDIKILFSAIMGILTIVKLLEYKYAKEKKDYENLSASVISLLTFISIFIFYDKSSPLPLALILMGWVSLMSVIKLIKVDYYMDRKNDMWYVRIVTFILFIILGLVTSINLYYSNQVQTLMIGFFFIVCGILEASDPAIKLLLKKEENK